MVDMEYRIWDANGEAKQMAAVVFFPGAGYVALNQDMYIINSIFRTDSCIKSLRFQP